MKKTFILVALFAASNICAQAQSMKTSETREPMVYIVNDIKISDSPSNSENRTTGAGTLGLSYKVNHFYGNIGFNVISNKTNMEADSTGSKAFANNLLIPENSGNGISSFYVYGGWKSFYNDYIDWNVEPILSLKRIGLFMGFQTNNTTWIKDTINSNVSIISPSVYLTYNIVNLELVNESKDKVYISMFGGLTGRKLGGDFGQKGNVEIRKYFLNLNEDRTTFYITSYGFMLELGNFFGKFQQNYTWGKDNIPGFSGWQSVVTVGTNINLNIPAKLSSVYNKTN